VASSSAACEEAGGVCVWEPTSARSHPPTPPPPHPVISHPPPPAPHPYLEAKSFEEISLRSEMCIIILSVIYSREE
jgi:hypothetical protein